MKKLLVISVGGSLISPEIDKIDYSFLQDFIDLVKKQKKQGYNFILVTGGGKTARHYISSANKVRKLSSTEADWVGIAATKLNASLLQVLLKDLAYQDIVSCPNDKIKSSKIIVASGYKPGRSSDCMAVALAKQYGALAVINMSNIDYVYDKDPKKYKDAQQQKNLTWSDFFKIIGTKWIPGKNVPFDPIASKLAQKNKIKVVVLNGKKLNNLNKYLEGKSFRGTVIE